MGPAVPSHLSRAWSSIPRSSRLDPKKTGEKSTANEVSRMSVEDTQLSEDIVNLIDRGATVLVNAERFGPKVAGSLRSVLGSMVLAFRGVHEAFENRWMTDHPSTDLFKENLSSCNSVLADLNAFLQSGNNDDKITREKVVEMEKSILGFINTLTLSLHLARKTKEDKNDPPIVQLIQTQLDSSCMWLYEQEIFPSLPVMSEGEKRRFTFNIQEAELSTKFGREPRRSYALVCPRAAFPVASDGREKAYELQFVCYCDEKTHKSDLNYNVLEKLPELAIPGAEAGPDTTLITWKMILSKRDATVSIRLSTLLPLHFAQLEILSNRLAAAICSRLIVTNRTSETLGVFQDKVSILRIKSTAPSQGLKIKSVEFAVTNAMQGVRRKFSPDWVPGYWQILQYASASKNTINPAEEKLSNFLFLDEPYFFIVISRSHPALCKSKNSMNELYKIRISRETTIREQGQHNVVITDVDFFKEGDQYLSSNPSSFQCSEIQLELTSMNQSGQIDAKTFIQHIEYMKTILEHKTWQKPFRGEEIVYQHTSEILALESTRAAGARIMIIYNSNAQVGKYRYVVTYGDDNGTICFKLDNISLQATPAGWSNFLTSQLALVVDRKSSGVLMMTRKTWQQLEDRSRKPPPRTSYAEATTFTIQGPNEISSTRWFDELADVVYILETKKTDRDKLYKPVKVAVIDTGFTSEEKDSKNMARKAIVKYRDFVARQNAADGKGKASASQTDDPITSMRDDAADTHGTMIAELILKAYKSAELYVARIFENNTGSDDEQKVQPDLMAKAIKWATGHRVDIINISGGFKTCTFGLHEAVRAAHGAGILIFASPGNWSHKYPVAFPARLSDYVLCIFSTTGGLTDPVEINPPPLKHAHNFAFLGKDINHKGKRFDGTSPATAIASGLAASILCFTRQPGVRELENVKLLSTKWGMAAVFRELVRVDIGLFECVHPPKICPQKILKEVAKDSAKRALAREKVKELLEKVLEKLLDISDLKN